MRLPQRLQRLAVAAQAERAPCRQLGGGWRQLYMCTIHATGEHALVTCCSVLHWGMCCTYVQ